ncbi:ATP-binding protein [Actinoplanes sp. GCM10030250]|uniref:ATP-binding protein n=1 Tax=Actinoplanes sp. GCM10030250 TaxID=3273376 RepID=UPI00360F6581
MTGWSMRRPPSFDEELARWTLGEAPELHALRAALQKVVAERLTDAADRQDLTERLTIVATELAGNALRHGRPPAVVMLQRSDGKLVIDVLDTGRESTPAVDDRRPVGGLGLVLAQRLAKEVGWYPTEGGKRVWATFEMA